MNEEQIQAARAAFARDPEAACVALLGKAPEEVFIEALRGCNQHKHKPGCPEAEGGVENKESGGTGKNIFLKGWQNHPIREIGQRLVGKQAKMKVAGELSHETVGERLAHSIVDHADDIYINKEGKLAIITDRGSWYVFDDDGIAADFKRDYLS